MSTAHIHRSALALAVLWVAAVAYLGLTGSRGVIGLPDDLAQPTQHLVSFFVMSTLLLIAFPGRHWAIFVALVTAGLVGELLQLTTEDREFAVSDLGMNILGIAAGLIAVTWLTDISRFVFALTVVLLVIGPFALPLNSPFETAFPSKCMPAPAAAIEQPIVLIDDLSGVGSHDVSTTQIREAILETSEFAVEAWFDTPNLDQAGPARIFTISNGINPDQLNFHLGVEGSSLSVRFRTSCEWFNQLLIDDVITVGQLQHIVVNWSEGILETWVDGTLVDQTEVQWGDFISWDTSFGVMIGDEFGGGRSFDGHVSSVTMWNRALDEDTIASRSIQNPLDH